MAVERVQLGAWPVCRCTDGGIIVVAVTHVFGEAVSIKVCSFVFQLIYGQFVQKWGEFTCIEPKQVSHSLLGMKI